MQALLGEDKTRQTDMPTTISLVAIAAASVVATSIFAAVRTTAYAFVQILPISLKYSGGRLASNNQPPVQFPLEL